MRILDFRPMTVRLMSNLWGSGTSFRGHYADKPGSNHLAARLAARITEGFIARRVAARSLDRSGPAIVSIGNLALGGTGKTPVVAALAGDLAAAGWKGGVLTRGFGSPLAGPLTVDPDNDLAGDEARLIATVLASRGWPVIQARRRERGLQHLLEVHPEIEVVVVEDGHQTAHLGRNLDVVILDGWFVDHDDGREKVHAVTGPVLPFGPWRESSAGADRAGIWLLETGMDMPREGQGGQAVATFQRKLSLRDPQGDRSVDSPDGQAAILSGIARPEAFENSLLKILARDAVLAVRCGDHVRYTPRMVAKITSAARDAGSDFLVTTAKDWVKLKPFWPAGFPLLVADLEICWGQGRTLPEIVGECLVADGHMRI
ncbi:MAG: tetraacyldisaccharide 4'-kinase [Candidatus Krumholzibacteria bacterium]|nr:tetraacyldisaccharide 4'-kinase [Candidatus Krumholzibacteria bacterium]